MSAPTQTCITCFNSFQGYAYKCNICLAQERQMAAMKSAANQDNTIAMALQQLKLQRMLQDQAYNQRDDDDDYVEPVRRAAPRMPERARDPVTPEEIEADRISRERMAELFSERYYYEQAFENINTAIRIIAMFSLIAALIPLLYFHFMPILIVGPIFFLLYIAEGSGDLANGICKLLRMHNDKNNKIYNKED